MIMNVNKRTHHTAPLNSAVYAGGWTFDVHGQCRKTKAFFIFACKPRAPKCSGCDVHVLQHARNGSQRGLGGLAWLRQMVILPLQTSLYA